MWCLSQHNGLATQIDENYMGYIVVLRKKKAYSFKMFGRFSVVAQPVVRQMLRDSYLKKTSPRGYLLNSDFTARQIHKAAANTNRTLNSGM